MHSFVANIGRDVSLDTEALDEERRGKFLGDVRLTFITLTSTRNFDTLVKLW